MTWIIIAEYSLITRKSTEMSYRQEVDECLMQDPEEGGNI